MSELTALLSGAKSQPRPQEERVDTTLIIPDAFHHAKRKKKREQNWVNSWPILVGILLAFICPMLKDVLEVVKPWGMWIVFPFVELMARPELHMGDDFRQMAPQAMLFLQFPLEGLVAKKFLRGRVTVGGVLGQVLFYHFLGAVQLWLVWRALGPGVTH
jgi:hypothetical protein